MKKIFFTIMVIIIASQAIAQTNNIYTKGTRWIYVVDDDLSEEFYFNGEIMFETITDDTVINNIIYNKTIIENYIIIPEDTIYDIEQGDMLRFSDGKYLRYYTDETYRDGFKKYAPEKFVGDDHVMYDEKLKIGDDVWWEQNQKVKEIGDTIFDASPNIKRKFWRHDGSYNRAEERDVYAALNNIWWVEGIGRLSYPYYYAENYSTIRMLMCCINANGDTIYKNKKYMDVVAPYFKTGISSLTPDNLIISPTAGGLSVILDDATDWSATLYNSNGVTVAQQQGNGSEIFLPTDGKGTHILVVKAGGSVVKKKVLLR